MFLILFLSFMCMEVIFGRNYFMFFLRLRCSTLACSSLNPPIYFLLEDDKEMAQQTAPVNIETKAWTELYEWNAGNSGSQKK